jgi:hypothetical protein
MKLDCLKSTVYHLQTTGIVTYIIYKLQELLQIWLHILYNQEPNNDRILRLLIQYMYFFKFWTPNTLQNLEIVKFWGPIFLLNY